jgi:hypothetical protein
VVSIGKSRFNIPGWEFYQNLLSLHANPFSPAAPVAGMLKVHKIENFFGSDFEFCSISSLVLLKY